MTAIAAGRIERSTVRLRTSTGHADIRTATDKYWSLLFVIIFIVFIAVGRNVVRHKSDCQLDCNNSTESNNTSEFFKNMPDSYETFINITVEYISHVWGQNWLFDAITCNVAYLDVHYEKSGVITVLAHLLVCGTLIACSCASMRTDDLYCCQLHTFAFLYLLCTFSTRLATFSERHYETDFFIIFAALPEIILFIVVCSKLSIIERLFNAFFILDFEPSISIMHFLMPALLWVSAMNFFVALLSLLIGEVLKNYEMSLNNEWSSYIFVGALVYICLTFYQFLLMVLSCATSLAHGKELPDFTEFFYALFAVARNHFGTACYQATLIFPRIHATFIMNEKEFKEIPNLSTIRRFYLAHWKVHNLSLMMTGARGYDYAASTREMLRLFTRDSPKLINFHIYKQMCRSLTALLIAINSLMFISLWVHGIPLDRNLVNSVWITSLIGLFMTNLIAEIFDTVADVLWLYYDGTIAITA